MGLLHEGVYGDHSTDGWLEWGLDARYARKRAEEDYTPASNELSMYKSWAEGAEHWQYAYERRKGAARAAEALGKAGMLAAAEAKIRHGVQIVGWESEWAEQRYRDFFDLQAREYAAAMAAEEARVEGRVEIRGDFSEPGIPY